MNEPQIGLLVVTPAVVAVAVALYRQGVMSRGAAALAALSAAAAAAWMFFTQ